MNGKKVLFLILALILPVAVFVFLKSFGRNEFEVPVMHQDSIPRSAGNCPHRIEAPYRLTDSTMAAINANSDDSLYVLYFTRNAAPAMRRVEAEFPADPIAVLSVDQEAFPRDLDSLKQCALLMGKDVSVTLIDARNRIRGYYDGADRDEVDRLIVEMKIILKKY